MGRDENGTLARLKAHRTERLEPLLARHAGRLVKLTGDGALVEFASAVDALSAAIEFQQAMAEANQGQPEDTAIVFRIGLHLGDLIVEGDDLYGDGVNVAARLEAEAPPGGIVVSSAVHDFVGERVSAQFDDLGSLTLKNIEKPVRAFGVKWDPTNWIASTPAKVVPPTSSIDMPLTLPDKPSIAVLPFQSMSGDPEQEYFADGSRAIDTDRSRFGVTIHQFFESCQAGGLLRSLAMSSGNSYSTDSIGPCAVPSRMARATISSDRNTPRGGSSDWVVMKTTKPSGFGNRPPRS
jgi:hypothetical protein